MIENKWKIYPQLIVKRGNVGYNGWSLLNIMWKVLQSASYMFTVLLKTDQAWKAASQVAQW